MMNSVMHSSLKFIILTATQKALSDSTFDYFKQNADTKVIRIEHVVNSTEKFNLKNRMQDKFFAL